MDIPSPHTSVTRSRRGVTLIEVLIVMTLVGLLAAVAIPRVAGSSDPYKAVDEARKIHAAMAKGRARAIAAFERAIELNPSLTVAYHGLSGMLATEHPNEAVRVMEKGIRLSPRDPQMHLFLHQLAVAHFMAGRYDDAVGRDEESLRIRADQAHVYRILAASLGFLGRNAEASASFQRALALARQEPERRFLQRRLEEVAGRPRAGQEK